MASIAAYPDVLRAELPSIDAADVILFGLVLGHADDAADANRTTTTREPVATNVTFT
jgi:hypothetical protein